MKKLLPFLLALTMSVLTSCSGSQTEAENIMTIVESSLSIAAGYTYNDTTDISSENYISENMLGYLYYGESSPPTELKYTDSFCIRLGSSVAVFELHIYKAKYQSYTDEISRMLNSRGKLLTSDQINPNDSKFLSETADEYEVFSVGKFVFLVVGSDISSITRGIKDLM